MRLVIKIGGHLLSEENNLLDVEYANNLLKILKKIAEKHRVVVVVGGGFIARVYIEKLRSYIKNESYGDMLGITTSRLNAMLLAFLMGILSPKIIPKTLEELLGMIDYYKIVFMGGLQPGQSTTTTAAIVAEAINADLLIIATDVDGIYTEDPRINPHAEKLDKISIDELKQIFHNKAVKAGTYELIDYLTISILERSKIPAIVLNGKPPANILRALMGEKIGTKIVII